MDRYTGCFDCFGELDMEYSKGAVISNDRKIEIYYKDCLDFIFGELVYRHSKRNALPDHAYLLKDNRFFNCAYRYS